MSVVLIVLAGTLAEAGPPAVSADKPGGKPAVDFRRDVYPLLAARCFACHQGADASSGVRLDDRAEIVGTTTGRPLVRAGHSDRSLLIRLVAGLEKDRRMPPKGRPLTASEVKTLRRWVDAGLPWNETLLPPVVRRTAHWAFQPIKRPPVPDRAASNPGTIRNPIDAFLAAKQRARGIRPLGEASRRVLIRRLSLDLRGIPPTSAEVAEFLQDDRPAACERLADRYLASPQYGERWGRFWLDVARWSESEGYESNHPRPFAWRYRDYVVQSFNDDKPFDEFVRQQIAGDELTPYSDENLIATGFLAAARISSNEEDKWRQRNDVLVDITNALGSAFLGLTVGCARCHNHKFDPLSLRDYYRLQAFFLRGQPVDVALRGANCRRAWEAKHPAEYEAARKLKQAMFEAARSRLIAEAKQKLSPRALRAVETPVDRRTVEQELLARQANLTFQATPKRIERYIPQRDRKLYEELQRKLSRLEKAGFVEPQTFAYYSPVTSPHGLKVLPGTGFYPLPFKPERLRRFKPYIKVRGDVHNIGPTVTAGVPAVFESVLPFARTDSRSEGRRPPARRDLADWLTDPRHPLTARVWVNRLWHYHFGRGIVEDPGDFGVRTKRPLHAELLDWLASELISSGWSTKHLQRLIVTSAAFRRRSTIERNHASDPQDLTLWRFPPRRLQAEAIRDCMLAVTGELQTRPGGRSVPLDEAPASHRRSLYLFQKRGRPPEMQKLFDGPSEASESCARRFTSTSPLQSLFLLNDEFTWRRSQVLAQQVAAAAGEDRRKQIDEAFRRILVRPPDSAEVKASLQFLQGASRAADRDPLAEFCQSLLNLNEFVYIE